MESCLCSQFEDVIHTLVFMTMFTHVDTVNALCVFFRFVVTHCVFCFTQYLDKH